MKVLLMTNFLKLMGSTLAYHEALSSVLHFFVKYERSAKEHSQIFSKYYIFTEALNMLLIHR